MWPTCHDVYCTTCPHVVRVFCTVRTGGQADNKNLDWFSGDKESQHPVFGEIIDGYDVVIAITAAPTGAAGRDAPNTPIVMQSITVTGVN